MPPQAGSTPGLGRPGYFSFAILIRSFRYRPEIDGLRAGAVLAAVLFHGGLSCTGGYTGVDVFFVIPGFLITSLISKVGASRSLIPGKGARRIVPTPMVVTLATLIDGWFLLLPKDLENLRRPSSAQAVFTADIYYWQDPSYCLRATLFIATPGT